MLIVAAVNFALAAINMAKNPKFFSDFFSETLHLVDVCLYEKLQFKRSLIVLLLHCCLMSTEARWLTRDGDRVGRGRESEGSTAETARKKTGETVDRRQNNGSVKAVSLRHCPSTCALCNCCINCCAWTESQCPWHRC